MPKGMRCSFREGENTREISVQAENSQHYGRAAAETPSFAIFLREIRLLPNLQVEGNDTILGAIWIDTKTPFEKRIQFRPVEKRAF